MKRTFLFALAGASLLAASAAYGADGAAPGAAVAQAARCGPKPMKPPSCLNGAWVCRCYVGDRVCDWELVGCGPPGSLAPRPGETRQTPDPMRPGDAGRPDRSGR